MRLAPFGALGGQKMLRDVRTQRFGDHIILLEFVARFVAAAEALDRTRTSARQASTGRASRS
jgi:hypothetical protein